MKLSQFKYNLPKELVASVPSKERDEARLMVVNRNTKLIEHLVFKDVIDFFDEGDLFIMNDTKVFPAKLYGLKEKTNAEIEVFMLREINADSRLWDVLVDPARKIRIGNKIFFGSNNEIVGEVIDNTTSRGRTMRFLFDGSNEEFHNIIHKMGVTPLPDDVLNQRKVSADDAERYQTIFAKKEGAVAAPTAGLHFSKILLKKMEVKGINTTMITLHNGLSNFRPIEVEDLTKHKSDSEEMYITEEAAAIINNAKEEKKKICAVGTTTMKAIETAVTINAKVTSFAGWTNKFIFPPYNFSVADAMITNFHAPLSPMLMMTAAFGGHDLIMEAYKEAIKEKYKFLTYGDAMLII
ncbi:MAG: tRNA preQ1(34) S-adenosylmethionine ribosyltransferase-isomerase QueA [Bacteroidales bacterium]|jgi:S-adenosylmethionine:tRNA ribosyltransferase-isomerase|nr:tRNA preQ1(34) S-adenosylmethionine ribosyltransferase-isomerase QueA [Bacteroidales bacterium]